jgi:hypothetical protein
MTFYKKLFKDSIDISRPTKSSIRPLSKVKINVNYKYLKITKANKYIITKLYTQIHQNLF